MAIVLLLATVAIIARKVKKNYVPRINLSGITIKDLNGKDVDMAGFAGKPLVINFWGTWCGPCRKELPIFDKASKKYGSAVNFLLISDEPVEKLIKFKAENSYPFFYVQSQQRFRDLGISSVPVTFFYDANGNLTAKKKDPLSEEELDEFVTEMIE